MDAHRPRILILSTSYLPLIGGSELAIKNITDRMPDVAFDMVTGRFGRMPSRERIGNIDIFRVGNRANTFSVVLPKLFLPLALFVTAWRLMHQRRYALVHVFQASQAAGAAWLLKKVYPSVPFILTLQEGKALEAQPWLIRFLRKQIITAADSITVISSHLERYARSLTRVPIQVIPNGVDVGVFAAESKQWRTQVREQLNCAPDEKLIISVSRLVEKNGLHNLISAMREVIHTHSATRLVIVGEGPLRSKLERHARDLGIASRVLFVGTVPYEQIPRYLGAADIFVRPSLSEGLGTAFLEAMASRVPVVASLIGGISDFVQDGKTGIVCNPTDSKSIAAGIQHILDHPDRAKEIAERAYGMVRERYHWDHIASAIHNIYAPFFQTHS